MRPYFYALIPIALVIVIYINMADRSGQEAQDRAAHVSERIAGALSGEPQMVICRACKGKVSTAPEKCPRCGNPQ